MLVKGEHDDPLKVNKWKTPNGLIETDDPRSVFDARTLFSLDSIVSKASILSHLRQKDYSGFAEKLRKAGHDPSVTFLPFLMRRLVTDAIARRTLPDTSTQPISDHWLLMAESVLMDIVSVADRKLKVDEWSTHSMAMRMMQAQYHDQLDYGFYKRELWLNQETVKRCLSLGLDLDDLYEKTYGLRYSELAALSFAVYATAAGTQGATFDRTTWNKNHVIDLPEQRISVFFDLCAVSYQEFQKHASNPTVAPQDYESYALSPLIRYPLVIRSDGLAVAPMLQDILERPTRAFQIDVLKALKGRGSDTLGCFNMATGETYEEFVRQSLESAKGCGDVRSGTELLPQGEKNCDFICIEEKSATLVEVKSVWTSLISDITKDRAQLHREFAKEGGVADGLIQLNESARMIRDGRTNLPKRTFLNAVLILRGDQVMLNSPPIRELLTEIVKEKYDHQMVVEFHLMNDAGLAAVVRLLAGSGSLGRFLYDKRQDKRERYNEFHLTAWARNPNPPPHPLDHLGNEALDSVTGKHLPKAMARSKGQA